MAGRVRLAAVPRSVPAEQVPARQPRRVTCHGRLVSAIASSTPVVQRSASGDHSRERLVGEHLCERRAHRRERERVRRERAADSADVDVLELDRAATLSQLDGEPVRRGRNAAGDQLADRDEVRFEPVRLREAAGAAADRVRLVDREQVPVSRVSMRSASWNPGSGWTNPKAVSAGSDEDAALVGVPASADSDPSRSIHSPNWSSHASTGGPRLPRRATTCPPSSVANASSTLPW